MGYPRVAQGLGSSAFGVTEVVGVINDTAGIRILIINPQGIAVE
jgi:hypothetical protein